MNQSLFSYLLCIFLLYGCTAEKDQQKTRLFRCKDCHATVLDSNHQIPCTSCHSGKTPANDKTNAHIGLIAQPAHPDSLSKSCGSCHAKITDEITASTHFTLYNSSNIFRQAFGSKNKLKSFLDTPQTNLPTTKLELADDLLRRRCFRCHVYSRGDAFSAVSHGTGCAACHMVFVEGKLTSHSLQKPGDKQCLSCHYGNYVGFDYYGRFEHDFNAEYRTPQTSENDHYRAYGVEYHQLKPDIHQLRGMICIDCHRGKELMQPLETNTVFCGGCHRRKELQRSLPEQIENRQGMFILHGKKGKEHIIPLLQNPAHFDQEEDISCQVCHAQWASNDFGKHFLRVDNDDFETWANLATQGNKEIETIIKNNNNFEMTELAAQMTDKITGEAQNGLWHKGFTMRRWETPILGRNKRGTIVIMRPLLDYHLSWIDNAENVRFDSVRTNISDKGLRPYVPHTTGHAGIFYKERIEQFLKGQGEDSEKK